MFDKPVIISPSKFSHKTSEFASKIISTRGKTKGQLKKSYPAPKSDSKDAEYFYVWRMVAFNISTEPRHHSMPMGANLYLGKNYKEACIIEKELDVVVNEIVNSVPKSQWYGVNRWSNALIG